MSHAVPDLLLTVDEVATALRLSKSYVKKLIAAGAIPSVKVGRSRRVRFGDLKSYVDALPAETDPTPSTADRAAPAAEQRRHR
ncbi:helix-turn-helix domain-containing protein [Dactylosporangium sp. NPDC051485]|uniref:helix-turn-helix domain-containing protein n=1 Tax=Dactylosporangium sp. NPDC051485 TaxID=3154846 RepID=UPI00342B9385